MHFVQNVARSLAEQARRYGVNPAVLTALYLAKWPPGFYFMGRALLCLSRGEMRECYVSAALCLAVTSVPYLYALIAGKRLPWLVRMVIVAALGAAVAGVVLRILH